MLDRSAEIGFRENEYYLMTPAEFDRQWRGYLLRNERADHRARMIIAYQVAALSGKKTQVTDLWPLPITDSLDKIEMQARWEERQEERDRLNSFVDRLIQKGKI